MTQPATLPKGYLVRQGYVGFLPDGQKMLFPTQDEYNEYFSEIIEERRYANHDF